MRRRAAMVAALLLVSAEARADGARVEAYADGGYAFRQLRVIPLQGGVVRAGVGAQWDSWTISGFLEFTTGRTEHGLLVRTFVVGSLVEYRALYWLRLGGGLQSELMMIRRATSGEIHGLSTGIFAQLTGDIVGFGTQMDHGLYALARIQADPLLVSNGLYWGPTMGLGFRW